MILRLFRPISNSFYYLLSSRVFKPLFRSLWNFCVHVPRVLPRIFCVSKIRTKTTRARIKPNIRPLTPVNQKETIQLSYCMDRGCTMSLNEILLFHIDNNMCCGFCQITVWGFSLKLVNRSGYDQGEFNNEKDWISWSSAAEYFYSCAEAI